MQQKKYRLLLKRFASQEDHALLIKSVIEAEQNIKRLIEELTLKKNRRFYLATTNVAQLNFYKIRTYDKRRIRYNDYEKEQRRKKATSEEEGEQEAELLWKERCDEN